MTPEEALQQLDKKYALFGLFFSFHNRLQAVGDFFYEEITCKQFFLLASMNLFPDEAPTANELAAVMGCSRQSVKEILNSLEKKGMIKLHIDTNDKRKKRVILTTKALQLGEKYDEQQIVFIEQLFGGVSRGNIKTTYDTILQIENNLKEMGR